MKIVLLGLSLLLTACVSLPRPTTEPPPVNAMETVLDNTVALVDGLRPYCAGVIVRSLVVTAEHCVDDGLIVSVSLRSFGEIGPPNDYEVLYSDPTQDLAILRPLEYQLTGGRLLAPSAPKYGDKVVVVGHPMGLAWSVSKGIVSHPRRVHSSGMVWMQTDANIVYGNSGGPAFNGYGEVVGIVSFMAFGERHLSGIVHWEEVAKALDEVTK